MNATSHKALRDFALGKLTVEQTLQKCSDIEPMSPELQAKSKNLSQSDKNILHLYEVFIKEVGLPK